MKHSYFADLLKRYLHDDCTKGEVWTVEQWYEARDMLRPQPTGPTETADAKARGWRQIQARTQPRAAARWAAPPVRWAAAAGLALALGLGALGLQQNWSDLGKNDVAAAKNAVRVSTVGGWHTCTNAAATAATITLADGSTVVLRPGSRLRYPRRFAGPERVVTLQGEAFFQVSPDATHPFRVLTDQVVTTVLGTSFTVRAFAGQAEAAVLVRTGRVRVQPTAPDSAGARPTLVLTPNQQAVYRPAARELRRELVPRPVLLRPQVLAFAERPVTEVLGTLEAGYGVPIRYDGAALANCTVSVVFGSESLFEKLDLLCKMLDASYERNGETIIFRSRGCQSE